MRLDLGHRGRVCGVLCSLIVGQFAVGCGNEDRPPVAPVKGVVTMDGKPVEGAQVTFSIKDSSRVSAGLTNDKGEYVLSTFDTDDGAIVGENLVTIRQIPKEKDGEVGSLAVGPEAMMKGSPAGFKTATKPAGNPNEFLQKAGAAVPAKYGSIEKALLKRSVVLGDKNTFNFDLKP